MRYLMTAVLIAAGALLGWSGGPVAAADSTCCNLGGDVEGDDAGARVRRGDRPGVRQARDRRPQVVDVLRLPGDVPLGRLVADGAPDDGRTGGLAATAGVGHGRTSAAVAPLVSASPLVSKWKRSRSLRGMPSGFIKKIGAN